MIEYTSTQWAEGENQCRVICGLAGPVAANIEHAGKAYHNRCVASIRQPGSMETDGSTTIAVDQTPSNPKIPKAKLFVDIESVRDHEHSNYYGMLGIDHLHLGATQRDISISYRKVCIAYHPDKQDGHSDVIFKAIQTAHDHLSDEAKRRTYDSTRPFDDTVPECVDDPDEFFKVFGEAFARNSCFSMDTNLPSFGDITSPYKDVDKFYDFWFGFKSWREYEVEDEYDVDDDACREEKRWVERQKQKKQAASKKLEVQRLRSLVENAFKCDPRVLAEQNRIKAERDARKKAKQDARDARAAEELQRENDKLAAIAQAEAAEAEKLQLAKDAANIRKKLVKKMRKVFKGLLTCAIDNPDLKLLTLGVDESELAGLVAGLEADATTGTEAVLSRIALLKSSPGSASSVVPTPVAVNTPVTVVSQEWSKSEVSLLIKAAARFPGGSTDRWDEIATIVSTKTPEQCMAKVKDMKKTVKVSAVVRAREESESAAKENAESLVDWTPKQQKQLETALRTVSKSSKDKWGDISKLVTGKDKAECMARFKQVREALKASKK